MNREPKLPVYGRAGTFRPMPTRREFELIELTARDCLILKQAADKMGISPATARTHRAALFNKMGWHSVLELCRWYWQRQLILESAINQEEAWEELRIS